MTRDDYESFVIAIHLIILVVLLFIAIFLAYTLTNPITIRTWDEQSIELELKRIESNLKDLKYKMRME